MKRTLMNISEAINICFLFKYLFSNYFVYFKNRNLDKELGEYKQKEAADCNFTS